MKILIDYALRSAPEGHALCNNADEAIETIKLVEYICNGLWCPSDPSHISMPNSKNIIEEIVINYKNDYDLFSSKIVELITIQDWLEKTDRKYPIKLQRV